jgi:hypothetical protein
MTFATAGNFGSADATISNSNTAHLQIAERVTFPDITGRDAPGKIGTDARPALVSNIGLFVSGQGQATFPDGNPYIFSPSARLSMWTSTGTNRVSSDSFSLPPVTTPTLQTRTIADRAVFSGIQYWVGFTKESSATYYFSGTNAPPGSPFGIGPTSSNTQPNFVGNFGSLFAGSLLWRLGYDVLPTAPASVSGIISGSNINLSWSAPTSDGGRAISGYRIQRSTDGVNFTDLVSNTLSTGTSYTDSGISRGISYTYRVAAINAVAIAHGSDYSGPYITTDAILISGAKLWDGTTFINGTTKAWNGTEFVLTTTMVWSGSSWVSAN